VIYFCVITENSLKKTLKLLPDKKKAVLLQSNFSVISDRISEVCEYCA